MAPPAAGGQAPAGPSAGKLPAGHAVPGMKSMEAKGLEAKAPETAAPALREGRRRDAAQSLNEFAAAASGGSRAKAKAHDLAGSTPLAAGPSYHVRFVVHVITSEMGVTHPAKRQGRAPERGVTFIWPCGRRRRSPLRPAFNAADHASQDSTAYSSRWRNIQAAAGSVTAAMTPAATGRAAAGPSPAPSR